MTAEPMLKWIETGWICAKGKRPKKKWVPTLDIDPSLIGRAYGLVQMNDERYIRLGFNCALSANKYVTLFGIKWLAPGPDGLKNWSIWLPPIKAIVV